MYSIAPAAALSADELWAGFAALRLLDEAVDLLAAAEGQSSLLVFDSSWRSAGLGARRLREALETLHWALMTETAAVTGQRDGIRAGLA